jgi:hypothetical protein
VLPIQEDPELSSKLKSKQLEEKKNEEKQLPMDSSIKRRHTVHEALFRNKKNLKGPN